MRAWSLAQLQDEMGTSRGPYMEFLRDASSMTAGLYVLPAGWIDVQSPHEQDEFYVVLGGRGQFTAAEEQRPVEPGDIIFVPAGVDHHFHEVTEELQLAVIFAPPEDKPGA